MTLAEAQERYKAWRKWEAIWSWTNILTGGFSVGLGALVSANTKAPFLDPFWAVLCAVVAPILTFLLTTLKPQQQAAAFKAAGRSLEKAFALSADPSVSVAAGIDILNEVK